MDCIVVGAGVIGLAVARALAVSGREVIVLESTSAIGTQVSARNSGVIHAGIYYPNGSVKARVCVAGKHALYAFCESHGVPYRRCGKLIVATEERQIDALALLKRLARGNGVDDLETLTTKEARALEPEVRCLAGLLSPSTGIIDVHAYLLALQGDAEAHGAVIAFNTALVSGKVEDNGIIVEAGTPKSESIRCRWLINCAALGAWQVARAISGFPKQHVPPRYLAKGNYFTLSGRSPFTRLIYPMPDGAWLGVHSTLDLGGQCKFGPDIHWVDDIDYDIDVAQADNFYPAIRRYWPNLRDGALKPDFAGIRPKLYSRGEPASDFLIQTPSVHGVPGVINLFGIESPGLTSSLAIAGEVQTFVDAA